jgi:hypothetical protein
MAEEFLSFNNSEQFRKKLVARNLAPYTVMGNFNATQGLQNYPIKLQDNSPSDSESVSVELYTEPAKNTRMNLYGPAGQFFDGAQIIGNTIVPGGGNAENNPLGASQEYSLQTENIVLNNEAFINNAEVVNRYLPPEGYEDLFVTSDLILGKLQAGAQIYGEGAAVVAAGSELPVLDAVNAAAVASPTIRSDLACGKDERHSAASAAP